MKHPHAFDPPEPATPFVERRRVRDVSAGRALATRERDRPEPSHYPLAPYVNARAAIHHDLVALALPFSDQAEEFRSLRTELVQSALVSQRPGALAVVSQDEGDGKSYIAANLAVSFSELGGAVLVIDADLRRPSQHELLQMPMGPGLAEVLCGQVPESDAVQAVAGIAGLHLLAAGRSAHDPLQLLQGPRMRLLLEDALARFDHVIVDTPANAGGPDARVLAVQAGRVLVVGRSGHTRVAPLRKLLEQLGRSPAAIAGVVLNDR
ncbi:CpsD/CapB family tyrosine-protein kinase [Ramlibacter sp. PS4R-6]|uniref:CpsD/CapB family tyrosine-protein kinase n=1 Tax=Ramlibacter sp. PS4R-6 TaxID=3133438 RepID=UPI0030A56409